MRMLAAIGPYRSLVTAIPAPRRGSPMRVAHELRFRVRYHKHNVPRLLHELGFALQRPRKRLARADAAKQATWIRKTFPAIKKKPSRAADS